MKKSDIAVQCLASGFNCAQAVFSTYCEFGLKPEMALKITEVLAEEWGLAKPVAR